MFLCISSTKIYIKTLNLTECKLRLKQFNLPTAELLYINKSLFKTQPENHLPSPLNEKSPTRIKSYGLGTLTMRYI